MKYQNSIILAALLIGLLILTFIFLKDLNLLITTIIGLLFSVPISLFWLEYKMPVLQIKKEIEEVIIELPYQTDPVIKYKLSLAMDGFVDTPPITYKCIRIIIDNIGRNAAKKCKSYFVTPDGKERICWTVPTERPNTTINVGDNERLDFCAFPIGIKSYDRIIVPHEDGWGNPWITGPLFNCKLLVTSENAEPVEASIKIDFRQETIEIE